MANYGAKFDIDHIFYNNKVLPNAKKHHINTFQIWIDYVCNYYFHIHLISSILCCDSKSLHFLFTVLNFLRNKMIRQLVKQKKGKASYLYQLWLKSINRFLEIKTVKLLAERERERIKREIERLIITRVKCSWMINLPKCFCKFFQRYTRYGWFFFHRAIFDDNIPFHNSEKLRQAQRSLTWFARLFLHIYIHFFYQ